MSKQNKIRGLKAALPDLVPFAAGLSVVALFAILATLFATSVLHADAPFPGLPGVPSLPATYPQFMIGPSRPHLEQAAARVPAANPERIPHWFRGVASWYGPAFNGRLTANGEIYDMYAMTAATTELQPELPLGSRVRVVNSHNGRSVVVHITDRGPLPDGRIIDLSYGAARKLAMVKRGVAQVRVQVLRWGKDRYHRG